MKTSSKPTLIFAAVLVLGLLAGIAWVFLGKKQSVSIDDWTGNWEVTYYYKNDQEMPYRGTLQLIFEDSLFGALEIFPPKSIRPEFLELQSLSLSNDQTQLKGELIHYSFMIREGFPKESFELQLKNRNTIKGRGACLEFCAEGTEGIEIIWQGHRADAQ